MLKIAFFLLISLDLNRVSAMKFLFGLPHDLSGKDDFPEENIRYIQELTTLLSSKVTDDDYSDKSDMKTIICRVESISLFLNMLIFPVELYLFNTKPICPLMCRLQIMQRHCC